MGGNDDAPIRPFKANRGTKKLSILLQQALDKKKAQEEMVPEIGATLELVPHEPLAEVQVMPPRADMEAFDPRDWLYRELGEVIGLLATAKESFRSLPDGENATSLTMLLREMRGFVGDLYTITKEDKDNVYGRIDHEAVQPFFREFVKSIVTEFNTIKSQCTELTGPEKAELVDTVVRSSVRNLRPIFTSHYSELMSHIAKIMGVRSELQRLVERMDQVMKQGTRSHD